MAGACAIFRSGLSRFLCPFQNVLLNCKALCKCKYLLIWTHTKSDAATPTQHSPQLGWLNWSLTLGQLYEALKLNIQTCHINTSYIVHPTSYIAHRPSCFVPGHVAGYKKKENRSTTFIGDRDSRGLLLGLWLWLWLWPCLWSALCLCVSISLWLCWLNICAIRSQKKSSCKNFKPQNLIHTEEKFLICFSRRCCCFPFFRRAARGVNCRLGPRSRLPSCSCSSCSRAW